MPFAGVVDGGSLPSTGMTTAAWQDVPVKMILISGLWATQNGVYLQPLLPETSAAELSFCGDEFPHVLDWNGRLYLCDGHHRVVRAALLGETSVQARVLSVP